MGAKEKKKPNQKEHFRLTEAAASWKTDHLSEWRVGQLTHHSDRGVQYAAKDYTKLLEEGEILISMSRKGNPYDNAKAERFMRTLKEEEVQGRAYDNLQDAKSRIGEFLEETYNRQRLHSALAYLTPSEFEQKENAMEDDPQCDGET